MIVYRGTKKSFFDDIKSGILSSKIDEALTNLGVFRGDQEYISWQNSLPQMYFVLDNDQIHYDVDIAIEYQIPLTSKRVDFLIAGIDENNNNNVVIIELKQWSKAKKISREHLVETYVGGGIRAVVHPSQQAYTYARIIQHFNESINQHRINLFPCAFLHNYRDEFIDQLTGYPYEELIKEAPLFFSKNRIELTDLIINHSSKKSTKPIFDLIENGKLRPSKALQDAVGSVLNGNNEFLLIDEQQVAYATVLKLVQNTTKNKDQKHTIIVKGGPGTGKSVIAINLLSKLISQGFTSYYVTKNSATRTVFSKQLIKDRYRLDYLKTLFKGSGFFYDKKHNEYDCLIVDEAHRLKAKSGFHSSLGENQVKEIINCSKVNIFFIDEDQKVTTKDIGTIDEIKKWANIYNSKIHDSEDLRLVSQFRCNGSDGYLAFLDDVLMIQETANKTLKFDYDIKVFDDPNLMKAALKEKNTNNKARMIAGYTYEWVSKSDKTLFDIHLKNGFKAQWNFSTDQWAIDPESFEQVGCIHSSQGLEFEYVGIIIGKDLLYGNGKVITDRSAVARSDFSSGIRTTKDLNLADQLIKNTYKTLLSRGQKGCYIYCEDEQLSRYLSQRLSNFQK
jgi:uncharacterized protein